LSKVWFIKEIQDYADLSVPMDGSF
jgi:hypothetical protein